MDNFLKFRKNIYSQNGEDGILEEIIKRINLKEIEVCEFGAWDGKHYSNTFNLVENYSAKAVYIEQDSARFNDLIETSKKFKNISPINSSINLNENLFDKVVSNTSLKKNFDILSIDIDSNDLEIWDSIKNYEPKIVIIEICSYILPGKLQKFNYVKNTKNSFTSTINVGKSKGYTPIAHVGNLIFIKNEYLDKLNIDQNLLLNNEKLFLNDWNRKILLDNIKKKIFTIIPKIIINIFKRINIQQKEKIKEFKYLDKTKKVYVLQHFGLGDFLSCKGLIKYLIEKEKIKVSELNLFVPEKHYENIKFLYEDLKNVNLIKTRDEKSAKKYFENYKGVNSNLELIEIGHSNFHKVIKSKFKQDEYTTDMVFYKQLDIPYKFRFEYGKWRRNLKEEERVYKKLNPQNKKYIFIHDDPSRNLIIKEKDLNIKNKNILIIKNDLTESIFNLGLLLERAEQIHVMESSIRNLIECLNIHDRVLFLHSFRKNLSKGPFYNQNSGKILGSQKNWKIITTNDNQNIKNYNLNTLIINLKKIFKSKFSYSNIQSSDDTFFKKIKFLIIIYIFKRQIFVKIFAYLIEKLQIKKDIGIEIFKIDFHHELDKCLFFTTRSLIYSVGNFINQKEYPNIKKKIYNNDNEEILFVKSSEIITFAANGLDEIKKKFILFSGDSDIEISITDGKNLRLNESIMKIINHKNLIHWYTQNLNLSDPKISNLPHGLDYHTIFERRKGWADFKCSPTYQEKELILTLNSSNFFKNRKEKIFNNWHFSLGHGIRNELFNLINKEDNFFLNKRLNRFLNWKEQSEYKYIFCPSGKGNDDPRIYESIILGNIPIRLIDNISKFHEDMPIIYIDRIEDLNLKFINSKFQNFHNQKFNFDKLFLNYWKNIINISKKYDLSSFQNISLDEFRIKLIDYYLKNSQHNE